MPYGSRVSVAWVGSVTQGMDWGRERLGDRLREHRRASSMDGRVRVHGPGSGMDLASDPVSGRQGAAVMLGP